MDDVTGNFFLYFLQNSTVFKIFAILLRNKQVTAPKNVKQKLFT